VIDLPADVITALRADQLGLRILADLIQTNEWNEYNYMLAAGKIYGGEPPEAVAEALTWLRARRTDCAHAGPVVGRFHLRHPNRAAGYPGRPGSVLRHRAVAGGSTRLPKPKRDLSS